MKDAVDAANKVEAKPGKPMAEYMGLMKNYKLYHFTVYGSN